MNIEDLPPGEIIKRVRAKTRTILKQQARVSTHYGACELQKLQRDRRELQSYIPLRLVHG